MKKTYKAIAFVMLLWAFAQFGYLGNPLAPCAHAQTSAVLTLNPQCPHAKRLLAPHTIPDSTSCMPPVECICQKLCTVLCKP